MIEVPSARWFARQTVIARSRRLLVKAKISRPADFNSVGDINNSLFEPMTSVTGVTLHSARMRGTQISSPIQLIAAILSPINSDLPAIWPVMKHPSSFVTRSMGDNVLPFCGRRATLTHPQLYGGCLLPYLGVKEKNMNQKDARFVIATLRSAAQARSDPSSPSDWRVHRDQLIDILDPTGGHCIVSRQQIRNLIDFLGEATCSPASRQSASEWTISVELAVERSLSALHHADHG